MAFLQFGAPVRWLSWCVSNSNVTMVFVGDISIVDGVYKLTYNWGAPPVFARRPPLHMRDFV